MAKKRRKPNRSPKGSACLIEQSPESKWINQWKPPKGSAAYFSRESDADFQRRHPVGYCFFVALAIAALLLPVILFGLYLVPDPTAEVNLWYFVGLIGAIIVGIGLSNFVAIIPRQYLGHLVSILSFLIGGIMMAVSMHFQ